MGRRKHTDAPAHRSINLPQSVALRWDMEFFSPTEGRTKAGKSELVAMLLRQHFDEIDGTRVPYTRLAAQNAARERYIEALEQRLIDYDYAWSDEMTALDKACK